MKDNNLIFTLSGIRGIARKDLGHDFVKKIAIAFGKLFEVHDKEVLLGRDTRPSGILIEQALIEGLLLAGFKIKNVGICPTPVIIYTKNKLNIPASIIITGSHNPQEWNGLKLLSSRNFLNNTDLKQISDQLNNIDLNSYPSTRSSPEQPIEQLNPFPNYVQDLFKHVNCQEIKEKNSLRVVLDTGAGTGKLITPYVLTELGCKIKEINNDFIVNNIFPREIEPIKINLKDLIMEVWQGKFDVGFAHDTDADRLAIIGDEGECYPEDIGLALITEYFLKSFNGDGEEIFFVTNLASSLMFDVIAQKYDVQVIRTPIGEKFLTEKMDNLIEEGIVISKKRLVFGGEGSCGGVMFPQFNKTRDGIFAAAKIIELLVNSGEKLSTLVSKLPKYFSHRKKILVKNKDVELIIKRVKKELTNEGEEVNQFNSDLRFGKEKEWFVLIHPSNTEPIIRVISEAKRKSLARIYCEATSELVISLL